MINITIVITSETCIDGKYNPSFLLEKVKELVTKCKYNLDIAVKVFNKHILIYIGGIFFLTNKLCACVELHLICLIVNYSCH